MPPSGRQPGPNTHTPTPSPYVSPTESPAEATSKAVGAGILFGAANANVWFAGRSHDLDVDPGRRGDGGAVPDAEGGEGLVGVVIAGAVSRGQEPWSMGIDWTDGNELHRLAKNLDLGLPLLPLAGADDDEDVRVGRSDVTRGGVGLKAAGLFGRRRVRDVHNTGYRLACRRRRPANPPWRHASCDPASQRSPP